MPYKSGETPGGTEKVPAHGKAIYRNAFNAAFKQYGEESAHAIAWAAVKKKYKKKEGKWVSKDGDSVLSRMFDYEGQPRGASAPGHSSGEFASSAGTQLDLPLTGGGKGHAKDVRVFVSSKRARDIIRNVMTSVPQHALHAAEHGFEHEIVGGVSTVVTAGLMALGAPAIPAVGAAMVAGYTVHKLAEKFGINFESAHRLLKSVVHGLRNMYEHAKAMSHSAEHLFQGVSSNPSSHAFGYGDAEDSVQRALYLFDDALSTHSSDELQTAGRKHPAMLSRDFNPNHAPGGSPEGGQFTSGEGGGGGGAAEGAHPGHGYSKEAYIDKEGVIQTSNPDDAVRALYEDKKVELMQPRQVSTLIDKLGEVAQRMEAKGFTGNFNLCNVSVAGSNLFCTESHGIARQDMPQLKGKPIPGSPASKMTADKNGEVDVTGEFLKHLDSKGFKSVDTKEDAAYMRSTQKDLVGAKVAIVAKLIRSGKLNLGEGSPLILSRDNYVLDGHHRWAGTIGVAASRGQFEGIKIPAKRYDIGTIQMLQEARRFSKKMGIPQVGVKKTKDHAMPSLKAKDYLANMNECPDCEGSGYDDDGDDCENCNGRGYLNDKRTSDTRTIQMTDKFMMDAVRKTKDGYLTADARIARTGIQLYSGSEVGAPGTSVVRVYRSPDEVFSKDAMHSLAHRPITLDHPGVMVDAANWKDYAVGHTGDEVVRDGDCIRVPLVIMDAQAIKAYEKHGIRELSVGYSTDLKWGQGRTPDGEIYDAKQTAIRGNHLAVVPAARGGSRLRIGDDKQGGTEMVKVLINGQTISFDEELIAKHVQDYIASLQKDVADAKKLADAKKNGDDEDVEAERKKVTAETDAMKGEIAALKAQLADATTKLSTTALDAAVKDRIDLLTKADAVMEGKADFTGKSDADVRRIVVDAKMGDAAKGMPDSEVVGAFKSLTSNIKPRSGTDRLADNLSLLSLGGGADQNNPKAIRDAAYEEYTRNLTTAWKGQAASR